MSKFIVNIFCQDGGFSKEEIFKMIEDHVKVENSNGKFYRGMGFSVSEFDNPENVIEIDVSGAVTKS